MARFERTIYLVQKYGGRYVVKVERTIYLVQKYGV